jgi:MtN3 and saliva related transmembrane protein
MSIEAIVALLTAILSILVKVVGMPDQVKANYRRKSTEGLSGWFLVCTLVSYGMWVIHGLMVHDMALVIGQGLGVIATGVIVGQMIVYRKASHGDATPARPTILWYSAMLHGASSRTRAVSKRIRQVKDPTE